MRNGPTFRSLLAALKGRESQRAHLQQQIAGLDSLRDVSRVDMGRVGRELRARVKDWRALLGRPAPVARQILAKLLDTKLVFRPRPEDRVYEFEGQAVLGKLLSGVVLPVSTALPLGWRPQREQKIRGSCPSLDASSDPRNQSEHALRIAGAGRCASGG